MKEDKINKEKEITKLKINNVRIGMKIETLYKTIIGKGKVQNEIMKEKKLNR